MTVPYTVLHGGFHKTASTFLQKTLQRNKGRLAKSDVHYVPHRDMRLGYTVPCQQHAYKAIGIRRKTTVSDRQLQEIGAKFFSAIKKDPPKRLILSDENLAGHCGNCIKTGQLYRYRDPFMASFARELPYPVQEIYLAVRNYADFFAAAYVEYFRSLQADSMRITPSRHMCMRVFNHMPGWNGVINIVTKHFPDAHIYVWKFEDFVNDPMMSTRLLERLVGDGIDVGAFKEPQGNNKRQSASGPAMAKLELLAATHGLPELVEQRVAVQEHYPRNAENGPFDPWRDWERAHLDRLYARDIERLSTNRAVTLLGNGVDAV